MTKTIDQVTDRDIRRHLDHGIGDRVVRVCRDGRVLYRGSTDPCDRSMDATGWLFGGYREDLARESIERAEIMAECEAAHDANA